jgi:hypothetical protein
MRPDPVDAGQGVQDLLLVGQIDTCNTSQLDLLTYKNQWLAGYA